MTATERKRSEIEDYAVDRVNRFLQEFEKEIRKALNEKLIELQKWI